MAQVPICVALTLQEELHQLAQGGFGGPMGSSSGFYEEVGLDRCVSLAESEITGKWERHPESWQFAQGKAEKAAGQGGTQEFPALHVLTNWRNTWAQEGGKKKKKKGGLIILYISWL